ncbi:hypothetical protein PVT67_17355 [Gallaecimonas kandeliae]|uniref:hypothetical protein n=1 Tax=Gallaecimonas kandeliae TaxID=3029055 RepID=UPI002648F5BE|nr:hypothetical protein [Gallaecimonas kandeliae]WKE65410.1 hypothetical protein PVT67_17355 [Gallaecimonas kandeliae]
MQQRHYQQGAELLAPLASRDLRGLSDFDRGRYLCLKADVTGRLERKMTEASALLNQGLDLLGQEEPSIQLVDCLLLYSRLLSGLGLLRETLAANGKAVALATELGDTTRLARALGERGNSLKYLGLFAEAEPLLTKAAALAKVNGDISTQLSANSDLVTVRNSLGQDSLELALENNELARHSPYVEDRAKAAFTLANVQVQHQHYAEALDAELAVYEELEQRSNLAWQGTAASNVAESYLALGDLDKADFYVNIALDKLAKAKLVRQRMSALMTAAGIAAKRHDKARQQAMLEAVIQARGSDDSPYQNKVAAQAQKALAQLTEGEEAKSHWQAYASLMAARLKEAEDAKQVLYKELYQKPVEAPLAAKPASAKVLLLALGIASLVLVLWLLVFWLWYRSRGQRHLLERQLGAWAHSRLPQVHLTLARLTELLGAGRPCRLLYFKPHFERHPVYEQGFRHGSRLQRQLGDCLKSLYPQALLLGEPDSFSYLVVLPAGEEGQVAGHFEELRQALGELGAGITGLHLAALDFPCFPQVSRLTEMGPLAELLLLGLQLAGEQGAYGWVELRPLPLAAGALNAEDSRQAWLEQLGKGYLKVSLGPDTDLTAQPDWAYLAQRL